MTSCFQKQYTDWLSSGIYTLNENHFTDYFWKAWQKGRNAINKNEDTHNLLKKPLCKWTVNDVSLLPDFTLVKNNAMTIDWWVQCYMHRTQRIQRLNGELIDTKQCLRVRQVCTLSHCLIQSLRWESCVFMDDCLLLQSCCLECWEFHQMSFVVAIMNDVLDNHGMNRATEDQMDEMLPNSVTRQSLAVVCSWSMLMSTMSQSSRMRCVTYLGLQHHTWLDQLHQRSVSCSAVRNNGSSSTQTGEMSWMVRSSVSVWRMVVMTWFA